MANFFDEFKKKEKLIPVIFVIGVSDNTSDEWINGINDSLRRIVGGLAEKNKESDRAIEYAVLCSSNGACWLTDGLVAPNEKKCPKINSGGSFKLGAALGKLEKSFSSKELFKGAGRYELPMVCFITADAPVDGYLDALKEANANGWFRNANKFAPVLENGDAERIMQNVCGSVERVSRLSSVSMLEECFWKFFELLSRNVVVSATVSKGGEDGAEMDSDMACTSCSREDVFEWMAEPSSNVEQAPDVRCLLDTDSLFDDDLFGDGFETLTRKNNGATDPKTVGDGKINYFVPEFLKRSAEKPKSVTVSQVQFSAVAPKRIVKGEYAMIDITVYEEAYRHVVDTIIVNADGEVKEIVGSAQEVATDTDVRIVLSSPDIDLSDCDETQRWRGRFLTYSFPVEIPEDYPKRQILFIASVYFNGVIATKLKMLASCTTVMEQKISVTREDVLSAFISYASQDRSRVATIIQGMRKARPDMDIFFDVESLRSGEDWEMALWREIQKRDVLYLCWSKFAKESEWVEKEWRYALENKGIECIEPVPLVAPSECPPPIELNSKHFNDRALLYKDV